LARFDDWINLLMRLLDAVVGLHPIAWWILRRIEREREIACDDWVVAHTGAAQRYAESLVRLVEFRMTPAESVLASGIFGRRSRLRERIEILLRRGRQFSTGAARKPVFVAAAALGILSVAGALAPRWIVFAQRLEFEVASVKRVELTGREGNRREMDGWPRRSGDLVVMHNTQPYSMIYYAYHLRGAYQMIGYPDLPDEWRWFDVDARVGRSATDDEVRLMFQSLLEDRFKLKVHRESREITQYELTLGKGKPKLKEASGEKFEIKIEGRTMPAPLGNCGTSNWKDGAHMLCANVGIDRIISEIGGLLKAPAVDRTGLTGKYDVHLHYLQDDRRLNTEEPGPTLAQAVQEDLGLKLEKGKGPVEVLVIDHLERPSANQ
jgi:uncharacterized protein (TIGR03435 family)